MVKPSSDDTVRISIYTQGLLNETIGFGLDLNLADNTELSINMNIMKETDDLYTVSYTQGDNYINGRIEIARAENTEEKSNRRCKNNSRSIRFRNNGIKYGLCIFI